MKKFLLFLILIVSLSFDAHSADETSKIICKIVNYAHKLGGPMITVVIIGASILAIFGRMPWPALFALGMFIAVFFGAPKIASTLTPDKAESCCPQGQRWSKKYRKCLQNQPYSSIQRRERENKKKQI